MDTMTIQAGTDNVTRPLTEVEQNALSLSRLLSAEQRASVLTWMQDRGTPLVL